MQAFDGRSDPEARIRFGVLGPLVITVAGVPVTLASTKQRQVLGILMVNAGKVVSTDSLIDEIWGEAHETDRQSALWVHISNLRKTMRAPDAPGGPVTGGDSGDRTPIVTRSQGYVLDLEDCEVDRLDFERLLNEGRALFDSDPDAASIVFAEALALWRGHPYQDFLYDHWAQAEIARLNELRLEAVEGRIESDLRRGMGSQLVGELEALVREHPLRERLAGSLMVALYRAGRAADALRVFQSVKRTLGEELGIEPSRRLREINDQVVTADARLEGDRATAATGLAGATIRGYELREQLDQRASGALYRAFQPAIGREVAIKVIRPELANDPSYVRRFEREAQRIAQLEHPHIIPLYDYWREPDGAYFVQRYMAAGSLERVIARGPLEAEQLDTLVDHVGSAIKAVHDAGLVHGNVTAENVLLDDDGNLFLTHSEPTPTPTPAPATGGPALDTNPSVVVGAPDGSAGHVEEWSPSPFAVDIAAFATLIAESTTGHRATNGLGELLVGIEGPLADALQRADAGGFADIDAFRAALNSARRVESGSARRPASNENPYKGLRSFGVGDALDFFGRGRFVERVVARLGRAGRTGRFVAVVGPSGSGKSSVVRAGVLPALASGAAPGSEDWFTIQMVPGRHPFEQLESALLTVAVRPPPSLLELLDRPGGLGRARERVLPASDATLLVVVDQFEELFTQSDADEAARFVDEICAAVEDEGSRIRIIVTIRADFYDRPLRLRHLGELIRSGTEVLTPMSAEELEQAIVGPAQRVGAICEPGLVGELVAATIDRPSALPLLQYTLTELFERRNGNVLTTAAYREVGGLSGALVERAEVLFDGLDADAQRAAREVFLRLVTLGDGEADTRRRIVVSELAGIEPVGPFVEQLTETFGRHRLLAFDRDPVTRSPTVEIAHEALLTEWTRLRTWIDDARSDVRAERRLAEATREWLASDRNDSFLLAGARLSQYACWLADPPVALTAPEQELLRASIDAEQAEHRSLVERRRRDTQLRRRSRILAGLAVVTALVFGLAAFAVVQQRRAADLADEIEVMGEARQLAARAETTAQSNPELATMYALHAARRAAEHGALPAEVVSALHTGVQATRTPYPAEPGPSLVLGGRGIYVMPADELVELAQRAVSRSFTATECRFVTGGSLLTPTQQPECPDPRDPFPDGLAVDWDSVDVGHSLEFASVADTSVDVFTALPEGSPSQQALQAELETFAGRLGIEADVRAFPAGVTADGRAWASETDADIVVLPQPANITHGGARASLIDLTNYLDRTELEQAYGPYLTSLLSVGEDGTGPSDDGAVYGVWLELDNTSLVWHDPAAFDGRAVTPPATFDELINANDRIVAAGGTPWCLGLHMEGAAGWPATDLIETLLVRSSGPDVYDAWARGEVPFDHPDVLEAADRVGDLVFTDGYLDVTPTGATQTLWSDGFDKLAADPPQCAMTPGGSFLLGIASDEAREAVGVFRFPAVDPSHDAAVVGGGQFAVAMVDRPEVRMLMRFMASPEFGSTAYFTSGLGRIPAHVGFDLDQLVQPLQREIAGITREAVEVDEFRFDASDTIANRLGEDPFRAAMIEWFRTGPDSTERIFADLERAARELETTADR